MQAIRNTRSTAVANEKSFAWRKWAAGLVVAGAATVATGDAFATAYTTAGSATINTSLNADNAEVENATDLKDGGKANVSIGIADTIAITAAGHTLNIVGSGTQLTRIGALTGVGKLDVNLDAAADTFTFGNIGTTAEKLAVATFAKGIITASSVNATTLNVAANGALAAGSVSATTVNISGALTASSLAATQVNIDNTGIFGALATNLTLDKTTNVLTQGGTFGADAGKTLTINGVVSGTTLTKTGNGTLVLAGTNTYNGTTKIEAGTLEVTGLLGGGNYVANIENDGTLKMNQAGNQRLGGVISGKGDLVKSGAGTLTLADANTYTGNTTINGGKISVTGSLGAFDAALGGFNYAGNVAIIAEASSLEMKGAVGADQLLSGTISGKGSLTVASSAIVALSGINTYSGGTTLAGAGAGFFGVAIDNGSALGTGKITVASDLVWLALQDTAAKDVVLDNDIDILLNKTLNLASVSDHNFTLAGNITGAGGLDLTAAGAGRIILSGANTYTGNTEIAVDSVVEVTGTWGTNGNYAGKILLESDMWGGTSDLILNQKTDQTLSGKISGGGTLIKSGANTLTLSNATSTYGATTLNAGKIVVAASSTVDFWGNVVGPLGSGTLTIAGANTTLAKDANATARIIHNDIDLDDKTLTVENAGTGNFTLAGTIDGKGGLVKTGTGNVTLAGNNTYTGNTAINSGNLVVTGTLDSGFGAYDGKISIANGSSLVMSNGVAGQQLTGVISGAGSLEVKGNFITLTGENTYSGSTTLAEGTLFIGNNSALGTGAVTITGANTTIAKLGSANDYTIANDVKLGTKTLTVTNGDDDNSLGLSGAISGTGGLIKDDSGKIFLSGASSYTGPTTLRAGTLVLNHATAGTIDAAGTGTITMAKNATLGFGVNGKLTQAITIDTAAGVGNITLDANGQSVSLSAIGQSKATIAGGVNFSSAAANGRFTLTQAAAYTGGTGIDAKTTVVAGAKDVLKNSTAIFLNGTFDTNGNDQTLNKLQNNGTITNSGRYDAKLTLNNVTAADATTFAGKILDGTGGGKLAVAKTGAGTLTLTGANTYSGGTTLAAGTLEIGNDKALGTGTVTVTGATTTIARGAGADYKIANDVNLGDKTLTLLNGHGVGSSFTLSGVISGTGSLIKDGSGEVILTGANTYSGATTVNGGQLSLTNTFLAQKDITVNGGGTLNNTGNLTIADGVQLNAVANSVTNDGKIYTYAKSDATKAALVAGSIAAASVGTIHVRAGTDAGDLKVGETKIQFFATTPNAYFTAATVKADPNKLFTVAYPNPAVGAVSNEVEITRKGARAAYPLISESVIESLDKYRLGTSRGVDAIIYKLDSTDESIEFAYNMAGVAGGAHHVAALAQSFTSSIGQRLSDTLPPAVPSSTNSSTTDDDALDAALTRGQESSVASGSRSATANTVWAAPIVGHQDGHSLYSGKLGYQFAADQYGALIGYEARAGRGGLWGIAGLAGGGTSVASGTTTHTVSKYGIGSIGVYTKLMRQPMDFIGQIGWTGINSQIEQRHAGLGKFAADVNTGAFYLSLGFEKRVRYGRLHIVPTLSIDFTSINQGAFTTTYNAGGLTDDAFKADAGSANMLTVPVGVKFYGNWRVGHSGHSVLRPDFALRCLPNVGDKDLGYKNLPISGTSAMLYSAVADGMAGDVNTGITWSRGSLDFGLRYNGTFSDRFSNHNGSIVLSKSF